MAERGRPSKFSEDVADEILSRLAEGECLTDICKDEHMPTRGTVWYWTQSPEHANFSNAYTLARAAQLEALADEIICIADDGRNDWMERHGKGEGVGWEFNGEAVRRSHLRVESRKWLLSRLHAAFRDRIETTHQAGGSLADMVAASYKPKE